MLCEKPIGLTASDVERLIALRDELGGFIAEAWMPAASSPMGLGPRDRDARRSGAASHRHRRFHLRTERSGECAQQRRACGRGDAGYRRLPCGSLPFRHRARASRDPCGGRVGKWRGRLHLGRRPAPKTYGSGSTFPCARPSGRKWCSRGWRLAERQCALQCRRVWSGRHDPAAVRRIRQGVPFSRPRGNTSTRSRQWPRPCWTGPLIQCHSRPLWGRNGGARRRVRQPRRAALATGPISGQTGDCRGLGPGPRE